MKRHIPLIVLTGIVTLATIAIGASFKTSWSGPSGQGDLSYVGNSGTTVMTVGDGTLTLPGATTVSGTLAVTGTSTYTNLTVEGTLTINGTGDVTAAGTVDAAAVTVDAGAGIDNQAAGALLIGAATATSVEIADTGVATDIQGTLSVDEAAVFDSTVNGRGLALASGSADVMIQTLSATMHAGTVYTNTFNPVFTAAPVCTATYTEDPGDVQPLYITSVASNQVTVTVTADKNFSLIAVGVK